MSMTIAGIADFEIIVVLAYLTLSFKSICMFALPKFAS